MTENELPGYLLASAKRALQGAISANVRQVSVGYDGLKTLSMRVVYESQPTEDQVVGMEVVTSEIVADIDFDDVAAVEVVVSSAPMQELVALPILVYERV